MAANISLTEHLEIYHDTAFSLSIMYVIVGLFGTITNCISVLAISTDKKLRRKNAYIIIDVLCVGYLIHGFGVLYKSVSDIVDYGERVREMAETKCFEKWLLIVTGARIVIDISLIIAIDRCIAVFKPHFFKKTDSWWWIVGELTVVAIHITIGTYATFVETSTRTVIICTILNAVSVSYAMSSLIEYSILVGITLGIYVFLIIWMQCVVYKAKKNHGNTVDKRKQMKAKLITTLALNAGVYFITMFLGMTAYMVAASKMDDPEVAYKIIFCGEISHFSSFFGLLALFFRMKEFRLSIFRLLRIRTASTHPLTQTSATHLHITNT